MRPLLDLLLTWTSLFREGDFLMATSCSQTSRIWPLQRMG